MWNMRRLKRAALILLMVVTVAISLCGCMMNEDFNQEILNIKEIVELRYDEECEVAYYLTPKDEMSNYVVTLKTEAGMLFNAYKTCGDDVVSDDYVKAIINEKLTDYLVNTSGVRDDMSVRVLGIVEDGSVLTTDFAENYAVSESKNVFIKLITVIVVNGDIGNYRDVLFEMYNSIVSLNSKVIEFEVISVAEPSEQLALILDNPLGYYINNWENFAEVSDYIDVRSKDIPSADELVKEASRK